MLQERRTRTVAVQVTPTEHRALESIAEHDGSSMADVMRRLIRSEAYRLNILQAPEILQTPMNYKAEPTPTNKYLVNNERSFLKLLDSCLGLRTGHTKYLMWRLTTKNGVFWYDIGEDWPPPPVLPFTLNDWIRWIDTLSDDQLLSVRNLGPTMLRDIRLAISRFHVDEGCHKDAIPRSGSLDSI